MVMPGHYKVYIKSYWGAMYVNKMNKVKCNII